MKTAKKLLLITAAGLAAGAGSRMAFSPIGRDPSGSIQPTAPSQGPHEQPRQSDPLPISALVRDFAAFLHDGGPAPSFGAIRREQFAELLTALEARTPQTGADREAVLAILAEWISAAPQEALKWMGQRDQGWFTRPVDHARLDLFKAASLASAKVDPLETLAALTKRPGFSRQAPTGHAFMATLKLVTAADPDSAFAFLQSMRDAERTKEDWQVVAYGVLDEFARSYPQRAARHFAEAAERFSPLTRKMAETLIFRGLANASPEEAIALIKGGAVTAETVYACAQHLAEGGERDSETALALLAELPAGLRKGQTAGQVLVLMASADTAAAIAALEKLPEGVVKMQAAAVLAREVAKTSPLKAVEIANRMTSREELRSFVRTLQSGYGAGPENLRAVLALNDPVIQMEAAASTAVAAARRSWSEAAMIVLREAPQNIRQDTLLALAVGSESFRNGIASGGEALSKLGFHSGEIEQLSSLKPPGNN
jgi:hypothetical protein